MSQELYDDIIGAAQTTILGLQAENKKWREAYGEVKTEVEAMKLSLDINPYFRNLKNMIEELYQVRNEPDKMLCMVERYRQAIKE